MSYAEIFTLISLAIAAYVAFVVPVVASIWRLASKVNEHTTVLDRVIGPRLAELDEHIEDHEKRIRTLEKDAA